MESSLIHRREGLILTAIDVINEMGIQGLSTREIAKRQRVSEATLFRHYKSKLDLIIAVLEYYAQYDQDIIVSAKLKLDNPIEAIYYYINSYVEYYENYPAITAITMSYDVLSYEGDLRSKVKEIFGGRTAFIQFLVDEAKAKKQLAEDTDSQKLAMVINGLCRSVILKWRFEDYHFSLKKEILNTLKMVLDAFINNKKVSETND